MMYFFSLDNRTNPPKPKLGQVYAIMVEGLSSRWYDVFLHIGIDRAMLDKAAANNPYDAHLACLEIITYWVDREDPPATWKAFADVLRHKLLEGKAADKVEVLFCSKTPPREFLTLFNEVAIWKHKLYPNG